MKKSKPLQPASGKFAGEFETIEFARKKARSRAAERAARKARRKQR